jgi:sugar phosphate isomerase/epimerase
MHRRGFLQAATAALALGGSLGTLAWAAAGAVPRRLGLQLFTVMVPLERDFAGTLRGVAAMGYKEVETVGTFGRDPAYVREMLDRSGLVSPSQHLMPGDLYATFNGFTQGRISAPEAHRRFLELMSIEHVTPIIEEGIARAQILGQKYIVWQAFLPEQMANRELLNRFCRAMNTAGELCANAGLEFNFHNQSAEFVPVNGYVPYAVVVENTDPRTVGLELDVFWAFAAKADPIAYFDRYPGRYRQCHLKDGTADGQLTSVGHGVVDFPAVLSAAAKAGVRHYYVEYDRAADPMKETRLFYDYLQRLM